MLGARAARASGCAMAISEAEASGVVEAALEATLGFVDPIAHALGARAAVTNDGGRIAAALARTLGAADAARVADAILARERPQRSDGDSDDERSGAGAAAPAPAWASIEDLDAQLGAFAAWVAPDADEAACAAIVEARLAAAARSVFPFAEVRVYGSRAIGVPLFDSDVDARLEDDLPLAAVAAALDAADWTRAVERIPARVPLIVGECRDTGVAFDVSRRLDGDGAGAVDGTAALRGARDRFPGTFRSLVVFLKVLLRHGGLDDVYHGGLGSFRLCVAVASHLDRRRTASPATALLAFLDAFASPRALDDVSFGGVNVDLSCLDDPPALARCFATAAARIRQSGLAAALDVDGLSRNRERCRRKAAAFRRRRRGSEEGEDGGPPRPAKRRRGADAGG